MVYNKHFNILSLWLIWIVCLKSLISILSFFKLVVLYKPIGSNSIQMEVSGMVAESFESLFSCVPSDVGDCLFEGLYMEGVGELEEHVLGFVFIWVFFSRSVTGFVFFNFKI